MHAAQVDTLIQALGSLEAWRAERPPIKGTGLAGLDDATGGFELGQVWILIGSAGQGRSALATQWAWLLASEHGFSTQLISAKDPVRRAAARLAASVAKVPLSHLWHTGLSGTDEQKLVLMRSAMGAAPLALEGSGGTSIANTDMVEIAEPDALVVDDAHLAGGMFASRVASIAARGILIVLTLPREHVVSSAGVDPAWADVADFIVDIDRPDLREHASFRPGEASFHLVRNRWGPTRTEAVAFQGHYARFINANTPATHLT